MRIRMKRTMAGPAGTFQDNKVYEFPDRQAKSLVEAGIADVFVDTKVETAEAEEAPEKAVNERGKVSTKKSAPHRKGKPSEAKETKKEAKKPRKNPKPTASRKKTRIKK